MVRTLVMALLVLSFCGCSAAKLNIEKTFSLPDGSDPDKLLLFEAQSKEQTITIKVEASDEINVGVYLKSQAAEPRDLSVADRETKAAAFKKGTKAETFTVKIPANTEYTVMLSLAAKVAKSSGKVTVKN
ncbi:MAG: hypothetical protein ACRC8S_14370 [Fimbriiglobus sp.]